MIPQSTRCVRLQRTEISRLCGDTGICKMCDAARLCTRKTMRGGGRSGQAARPCKAVARKRCRHIRNHVNIEAEYLKQQGPLSTDANPEQAYCDKVAKVLGLQLPANSLRVLSRPRQATLKPTITPLKNIEPDYYRNLLDWSDNGVVGVALPKGLFAWSDGMAVAHTIVRTDDAYISSVSFGSGGDQVAIGKSDDSVAIWDVATQTLLREIHEHTGRVEALSWKGCTLSSGGLDTVIVNHDVRTRTPIGTFKGHEGRVCGLRWSPSKRLLASGGNDNRLNIWDDRYGGTARDVCTSPLFSFESHVAAVKAIDWCPWNTDILASGGGTNDQTLRLWDMSVGKQLRCQCAGSQVCALRWSQCSRQLVSAHGWPVPCLVQWNYSLIKAHVNCDGHSDRILHMARSPDGEIMATASADQTMRFWNLGSTVQRAPSMLDVCIR